MKRLAAFIGELFGISFGWVASLMTAKVAVILAVVTASLGLITALFMALRALTSGLVSLVPDETFRMAFWAIWPSNAEACIAACFGADAAVFLYRFKDRLLGLVSQ
jgi:hypothetical protein